jgi:hypothetical protein
VKYTNDFKWVDGANEQLSRDLKLIVTDVKRIVQKWSKDNKPLETIILGPGEKWPDVEAKNEEAPRSEWREDPNGKMVGPWQRQYVVYLLDPTTMNKYTYPTSTIGGGIAVRDLVGKVVWMRRFRGQNVHPVITLSDTFMKTRFSASSRQRPHFNIVKWVLLDGGGEISSSRSPALSGPASETPAITGPATAPDLASMKTVNPPSAKEVTGDEIPW